MGPSPIRSIWRCGLRVLTIEFLNCFWLVRDMSGSFTAKILLVLCISSEMAESTENMTFIPYVKTPRHRGAARQMYGSGSLRPRDSHPIYATDRRFYGERSTISPDPSKFRVLPIPLYPYPQEIYPVPEVIGGYRSSTRSGGPYGGRIEYYSGKPQPVFVGGKYPFDLTNLQGRGFKKIPQIHLRRNETRIGAGSSKVLIQPSDDMANEDFEHTCEFMCATDEFLCSSNCNCIKQESRCDKKVDCKDNEDELDCSEYELERHIKCNETQNIRCSNTGKCILKEWLCDGEDDCGDFSDETRCEGTKNCTTEEFECANGLCIPKTWVCDDDVDCKDFSDEWNCTQAGCKTEEFDCGDGTCVSQNWKCDGQKDCADGRDEELCNRNAPKCLQDEFLCSTHKCIKIKFKCDGDNDCGDWSDEYNCKTIRQECVDGEFRCNDGRCIPDSYRCDKQRDCENGEDEANCDYSVKKNCSFDEYTCLNGACILKTWVCDGFTDCSENEDEKNCSIICDESKYSCAKFYPVDNTTSFCINKKHVCDSQEDCPNAEDEMNCPKQRECEKGTKCQQLCVTNHDGSRGCACRRGFALAKDGYKCIDIDECQYATDPVCSQTCTNIIGSFKCGCLTGYVLRPDQRSCKAQGATPTLLFANRKDIRQASLSSAKYTAILKGLHNAIFLNYHYEKQLIFWSDMSIDVIRRAYINGSFAEDVIKIGLEAPGGLAIDWIHDLLFWTDAGTQRVEVASLDGKNRAILAANDMDKPRAIVVHPGEALVFWTDWGPNPKIERAEMDGKNRKRIVTESIFWPNGLTLDYTTDRIYWADAKHNVIESSFLDGANRKKVVSKGLPHPFAMTIFEDIIYWTDWHTKSISSASKSLGVGLRTIHSKLNFPMDIHSYHPQRQPKYRNHCDDDHGCSHMCLPNKKSYSCVCRFGQKLAVDGKACVEPEKFIFFTRKKNLVIKHLDDDALHQHDIVIPTEGLKAVSGIAWDSTLNMIFWTDVEKKAIYKAFWNGSNQQAIVETNLESPIGLGYDWLTMKIYWVDTRMNRLEVVEIDGNNRCLLVWEDIDTPRDIVINPYDGFMYWAAWGKKPRIEKTGMDGSARNIIITEDLMSPSGLSIDYEAKKLYWADGSAKAIYMSNLDGTKRKIILEGSSIPHPYGLDVFGKSIYWTDWINSTLEKANKQNGSNRTLLEKKLTNIMQVKVFHRNRRMTATPCSKDNGGCSHLCLLKPLGYSCACPTGIKLKDDGKTCANGPTNYLILARGTDIRQISLDVPYTADVVLPFPTLKMAISVDVDRKTGEIYWTDTEEAVIKRIKPDGSDLQIIIMHELMSPDGMAIDSTGRKIYWTDRGRNSIEVCEMDGSNRKVLFSTNNGKPRAITLHYHHGLIFWSDWGDKPRIEVAHMDGRNRKIIIDTNLAWPNGLAIDRPTNRLYWNDGSLNKIESCNFNGQNRRIILQKIPHPYGLVIVGNHMYWTDWESLHRAEKLKGSDVKVIRRNLTGLMDVRAVQTDNIAENACGENNGGCSHLCLRNPTSYTCACPTGILLKKNSTTTCEELPSNFLLVSTRFAISRISLDTPDAWDYTLPIKNINEAYFLDFHWGHKKIFYNDFEQKTIRSINMNDLTDVKDVVPTVTNGIAVDWVADNIYWTNSEKKLIEVAKLDGTKRKVLIGDNLQDPHSVAVYPRKGFLYWTDWKDPKIERSLLDGSSRLVLINEHITFPLGLTIDYSSKRLYWIDVRSEEGVIETANLHGQNRITLDIAQTFPYSLAQLGSHIYWTDWKAKKVYRADKTSGKEQTVLIPDMDAAMGMTMVSQVKQIGWNPCAINNGGCEHLCFYTNKNYTCGCPDDKPRCNKEPSVRIPDKCPKDKFNCGNDYENDEEQEPNYYDPYNGKFDDPVEQFDSKHPQSYYIISFLLLACVVLMTVILVAVILFLRGKHRYGYGHGSSFANPNYYSPNNESGATNPTNSNLDKRQFIWKRLKYDKSQERVYEETVGSNSPEVVSLIPMYLTPNSSKCDGITSSLDRSPSAPPLQELTEIDPVI